MSADVPRTAAQQWIIDSFLADLFDVDLYADVPDVPPYRHDPEFIWYDPSKSRA